MMKKKIIYTDYSEDTDKIANINVWFTGDIEFEVEINNQTYHCNLFNNETWCVAIYEVDKVIELARLSDTYWNARQIWNYIDDSDAASAISGAIKEIYNSALGILN